MNVEIDAASVDSNHAERDKHLRNDDFLDVDKYPKARFVSTAYRDLGNGKGELQGELTLHGLTRPITIDVTHIGMADIVKIATMAHNPHDNLRMLEMVKKADLPTVGMCMGDIGTPSRMGLPA